METNQQTQTRTELAKLDVKSMDMASLESFGERIAKSEICPLKKGSDVVAAILMGNELGLSAMVSVNNIYPINGKASLGIHAILALLTKAGVTYEILHDFEHVYNVAIPSDQVKDNKPIPQVIRKAFYGEVLKGDERFGKTPVDTVTEIKFERVKKAIDGSYKTTSITIQYSIGEASTAGLMSNNNWAKHPKTMLRNRCLTIGGRLIGADILLGIYEVAELAEVYDIPYSVEEDGKVTLKVEATNKTESSPSVEKEAETSTVEHVAEPVNDVNTELNNEEVQNPNNQ